MSIVSRLTESKGFLLTALFYLISGILGLVVLSMTRYPPHMAILGIFSLIAGYGLLMKRNWTLYLVTILFLTATAFSIYMLYYLYATNILIDLGATAYLVLTWVATIYVVIKRSKLES